MLTLANRLGSVGNPDASIFSVTCADEPGSTLIPWNAFWLMMARDWNRYSLQEHGPNTETFIATQLSNGRPQFAIDADIAELLRVGAQNGHTFQTSSGGLNTTFTLTFLGTVDQSLTIDWGDGSTSGYSGNEVSHTYAGVSDGDTKTISVTCASEFYSSHMTTLYNWGTTAFSSGNALPEWLKLIQVDVSTDVPTFAAGATFGSFYGNFNLNINADLTGWDVSNVTNMQRALTSRTFNQDISGWDVSNVSNFASMFWEANTFNQDIGSWNMGNATTMYAMFNHCYVFNQNISSWNTGNVTNMKSVFYYAYAFSQDIRSWNVTGISGAGEGGPSGHSFLNIFFRADAMNSRFGFSTGGTQNGQNLPYAPILAWFNSD